MYLWLVSSIVTKSVLGSKAKMFWKKSPYHYVDKILAFFDHLSSCVDIFNDINVDKNWTFLDHLPTSSCKRSLWTAPNCDFQASNVDDRINIDEPSFYNEEYNETKDNVENDAIDPIEIDEPNC